MRVAGKGAESSEVGESVDEGRLENCPTKRGMIKSLSQGQFAARKTRGVDERKPSPGDEMRRTENSLCLRIWERESRKKKFENGQEFPPGNPICRDVSDG